MSPDLAPLLSHLVPAAADRDAGAIAIVDADVEVTYAEAADRIARLAGALAARGVGAGDRVLIFAPKSADTFLAMHAALHVGGIAVPVDPRSGAARVRDIVHTMDPAAAVVHPSVAPRWPTEADDVVRVGGADDDPDTISWNEVATTEPIGPRARSGADPAYIITTSGSTGTPKGIVHTHASGLAYADLSAALYDLTAADRMANVAPFHFDQSTFELYAGPLVGAAVVLVGDALVRFPAELARLVASRRVTIWYSVPTILRDLLHRGGLDGSTLATLRWVLFGGEIFPANELRELMALAANARFSNVYGPAEVNQCTFHHLDEPPADDDPVPIGRAWDDTRCRLVEPGEPPTDEEPDRGELLVHTTTVMQGYWERPDLTADAFVDEPHPDGTSTRWYRTGDLVERDADGVLHFHGRLDRQVKVRGVRVELEAVEAVFNALPGVGASAAGLTPGGLLAVLVESSERDDSRVLQREARPALPAGADPHVVEIVGSLPRTGSDKVDHAATAARFATFED